MSLKETLSIYKSGNISLHKNWELQTWYQKEVWSLGLSAQFSRKCDHAGFVFELDFLGFSLNFSIADGRHWDEENDAWKVYDSAFKADVDLEDDWEDEDEMEKR